MAVTVWMMVIDETHRLHERVASGGADKFPAELSQLLAHVCGLVRNCASGVKFTRPLRFEAPKELGQ